MTGGARLLQGATPLTVQRPARRLPFRIFILVSEKRGVLAARGYARWGIKVGFHGHVHKSHAQLDRFITDDSALVSTGTLGAAADDRPDAVATQFSIVELHRTRLRVEVYERLRGRHQALSAFCGICAGVEISLKWQ